MSIENKQEQLIVPEGIGSTTPIESAPEIPAKSIQNNSIVTRESVTPIQSTQVGQKTPSNKEASKIDINGAQDGIGWFALMNSKKEGSDIEVL